MSDKPVDTLRDGVIQVTIWKNESNNGSFYNAAPVRRYKDDEDNWQDAHSFSGGDILKAAKLMEQAYEKINDLRKADKATA